MGGEPILFSEEQLRAAVEAYDPALSEAPAVIGHPKAEAPAYGWVKKLEFREGAIVAELDQVDADFEGIVKKGSYKKISPSWYPPDHPQNPKPGSLYLRHIGFLGATPPSVKGLKNIEFAEDADVFTFEFADDDQRRLSWTISTIGRALQAMREFIIVERGEEAADKAIPKYDVEEVHRAAGAMQESARAAIPAFSEEPTKEPTVTDKTKELESREAELKQREEKLNKDALDFAEQQKKSRREADKAVLDQLAGEGKLAAGYVGPVLDFMEGLGMTDTLDFGEGETKQTKTPRDFFLDLLRAGGTVIDFSERSRAEQEMSETLDFAAPDGATVDPARMELHRKAVAHQKANPNTSYADALRAVGVN